MFTSRFKTKSTLSTCVNRFQSRTIANMSSNSNELLQFLKRARQSKFVQSLKPDPRIPYPPFHLVPDSLKINDENVVISYANNIDFYQKKYSTSTYKGQITYDSYLSLPYLHRPRQLLSGYYTYSLPDEKLTNSANTKLLSWSPQALEDLDLKIPMSESVSQLLCGTKMHSEIFPYSQAYAGFQFGQFAGQLGDGRVINLFELPCKSGETYELQVKGAGLTAFSRFADGKAVIRSCVREFLISEFLHSLKVPTVRCLAVNVLSDKYAQRGSSLQPCGTVTRFSHSWIRIGNFDLLRARGVDVEELKKLSDFCIDNYFPGLKKSTNANDDDNNIYVKFYQEVVKKNAETTAITQAYGFLNGVLNTDNTSILGYCMDFGPFAVMDRFDPQYTPNSEDHTLRYSYENTPSAIWWNLHKLGEAIYKLFVPAEEQLTEEQITEKASVVVEKSRQMFEETFFRKYVEVFGKRLGFNDLKSQEHDTLIAPMLSMLWETGLSYNKFFYYLANKIKLDSITDDFGSAAEKLLKDCKKGATMTFNDNDNNDTNRIKVEEFLKNYKQVLAKYGNISDAERLQTAKSHNPRFIPSGWVLEEIADDVSETCRNDSTTPSSKLLNKAIKMTCFSTDDSRWGDELKEVETKWCEEGEEVDTKNNDKKKKHMLQCSCAS